MTLPLRHLVVAALIAGMVAGTVLTAAQTHTVTPVLLAAERIEQGRPDVPLAAWPPGGWARLSRTWAANILLGTAYGLLLAGAITLRGKPVDAAAGALWGLAGFACLSLAPGLGLPPELPGLPAGDVEARQLWWLGTAATTAAGLSLAVFGRHWALRTAGLVALAVPHIIGAPAAPALAGSHGVPATLAAHYVAAVLATQAVFWVLLGLGVARGLRRTGAAQPE